MTHSQFSIRIIILHARSYTRLSSRYTGHLDLSTHSAAVNTPFPYYPLLAPLFHTHSQTETLGGHGDKRRRWRCAMNL